MVCSPPRVYSFFLKTDFLDYRLFHLLHICSVKLSLATEELHLAMHIKQICPAHTSLIHSMNKKSHIQDALLFRYSHIGRDIGTFKKSFIFS